MQPTILWSQRNDYVWLTVDVANAEDLKVDLSNEALKFHCLADSKEYKFELKFFKPIIKEESKFLKHRLVDFCLKKSENEDWSRLTEDAKKQSWIKVDWSKWQDSDAEDEPQGGFDMSNMGGFGGMDMGAFGGMDMGDMAGMAGMGAEGEDSDDEEVGASSDLTEEPNNEPAAKQSLIEEVEKAN